MGALVQVVRSRGCVYICAHVRVLVYGVLSICVYRLKVRGTSC